jgi:hypothetical protein
LTLFPRFSTFILVTIRLLIEKVSLLPALVFAVLSARKVLRGVRKFFQLAGTTV